MQDPTVLQVVDVAASCLFQRIVLKPTCADYRGWELPRSCRLDLLFLESSC